MSWSKNRLWSKGLSDDAQIPLLLKTLSRPFQTEAISVYDLWKGVLTERES